MTSVIPRLHRIRCTPGSVTITTFTRSARQRGRRYSRRPDVGRARSKMISICIPVYNFNVVDTVRRLLEQADRHNVEVEVVIFDDRSLSYYEETNRALRDDPRVRYLPLIENMGRSRIRNCLADYAQGDWLLFMDCDMEPADASYLHRYEEQTHAQVDVVCGGVDYGARPQAKANLLRWRAELRRKRAYERMQRISLLAHVTTGNFLVRRETFQRVRFNENLQGYGQEDQLFSLELARMGARVTYIDNPMVHLGYESNEEFLRKSEESLVNQVCIWNANPNFHRQLFQVSPRLRAAVLLRRMRLWWVILLPFYFLQGVLRRAVLRGDRWMGFFHFYQTGYLLMALRMSNLRPLLGRKARASFVQANTA